MGAILQKWAEKRPWYSDYVRSTDDWKKFVLIHFVRDYFFQPRLRYMVYFRNAQKAKNGIIRRYYELRMLRMRHKCGIEILTPTQIGPGFLMIHPYNITISPQAKLGKNINIFKGATIGYSQGSHPGYPVIGNDVYIGLNAVIVGGGEYR